MRGKLMMMGSLAALGALAFGLAFVASRWLGRGPAEAGAAQTGTTPDGQAPSLALAGAPPAEEPTVEQRHLYDLIREVRARQREAEQRLEGLRDQERRMALARQELEEQARGLEKLRVQLASGVANLKQMQAELIQTRVVVKAEEQANLKRTAEIYNKMDSAAAGKILQGMCLNGQDTDAARILYYMEERSVAKVLAEMTDKALVARLCDQMKRIREEG